MNTHHQMLRIKKGVILMLILFGVLVFVYALTPSSYRNAFSGYSFNQNNDRALSLLEDLYKKLGGFKEENRFLLLFQNNLELRPSGGFIGSFGLLSMRDGKIVDLQIINTNTFDAKNNRKKTAPPFPIGQYLFVDNWQLRDANWSPDFAEAARQALDFYVLESGDAKSFDGIIALNPFVLVDILRVMGPLTLKNGLTFSADSVLEDLEYEVEIGFASRSVSRSRRKDVLNEFADEIIQAAFNNIAKERGKEFAGLVLRNLKNKNILMYFSDPVLQEKIESFNFAGRVDTGWDRDYLMVIDANLGGLKTDLVMQRSIEYSIDRTGDIPKAVLEIHYRNPAQRHTFLLGTYKNYVRVYVPEGSWLLNVENTGLETAVTFEKQFNKTVFGGFFTVPVNNQKTLRFEYALPRHLSDMKYALKIQKQSGIQVLPVGIRIQSKRPIKTYNPQTYGILQGPKTVFFAGNITKEEIFSIF